MPSSALPAGVTNVTLRSTPLSAGAKNIYYVAIQVVPSAPVTTPVAAAGHVCQVDTGSCGIVVPEAFFYQGGDVNGQLIPGVTQGGPAKVVYQPSSDDLVGNYYTVAQLAVGVGQDGAPSFICENVTAIGASNMGADKGMMGVGFGRPTELGTNVFLNAPGMADGSANPSFLMTPDSISLGWTQATLPNASTFGFQQLSPNPKWNGQADSRSQAWLTPAATITLSGQPQPYQGTALLDTGLNLMMLSVSSPPNWQASFIGQTLTVSWPTAAGQSDSILSYSMTITGKEPAPKGQNGLSDIVYTVVPAQGTPAGMMPMYIVPIHPSGGTAQVAQPPINFVNTGINVILGANFFFDAKAGCIGFAQASAA